MPKMKTHKGTAKRMRLTKKGKVMRMRVGRNHLRRKKSGRTLRSYRRAVPSEVKKHVKLAKQVGGDAVK